jgi:hypothetical protein
MYQKPKGDDREEYLHSPSKERMLRGLKGHLENGAGKVALEPEG